MPIDQLILFTLEGMQNKNRDTEMALLSEIIHLNWSSHGVVKVSWNRPRRPG